MLLLFPFSSLLIAWCSHGNAGLFQLPANIWSKVQNIVIYLDLFHSKAFYVLYWTCSIYYSRLAPVKCSTCLGIGNFGPTGWNTNNLAWRLRLSHLGPCVIFACAVTLPDFQQLTVGLSYAKFLKGHPYSGFYVITAVGLPTSFSSNQIILRVNDNATFSSKFRYKVNRFLNIRQLFHMKQIRRQREDFFWGEGNSQSVLMIARGEQPKIISCNILEYFLLLKSPIETIYLIFCDL